MEYWCVIVLYEICLQVCVLHATIGCVGAAKNFMTTHRHQSGGDFSPQAYTSYTIGLAGRDVARVIG